MPKRHLDNVDINLLQEVGGKLTQRVRADLHGDAATSAASYTAQCSCDDEI